MIELISFQILIFVTTAIFGLSLGYVTSKRKNISINNDISRKKRKIVRIDLGPENIPIGDILKAKRITIDYEKDANESTN